MKALAAKMTFAVCCLGLSAAIPARTQVLSLTLANTVVASGIVGSPYSQTLQVRGGTLPYNFAVTTGALLTGLTLNASTGTISGTPTSPGVASLSIRVRDSVGTAVARLYSLYIYTPPNLAEITFQRGDLFFRVSGKPSILLGRNPTGWLLEQYQTLLGWAGESGEKIILFHVTIGRRLPGPPGEVDEDWAVWCENIFDMAAHNGLYVLPGFAVWSDWNDGSTNQGTLHFWDQNPYSKALGGPASSPTELLQDTETQRLWLQWLGKLVARWQDRPNILGWEIFSELDLITNATEDASVDFVQKASKVIRAADKRARPVTAALAGIRDWPKLSRSDAIDFLQVHPYADGGTFNGNLDDLILFSVRQQLGRYGRPVFIGEGGLSAAAPVGTLTVAPRAFVGIKQAIWASAVSGSMVGRMLWFEDGYDQYHGIDLRSKYKDASVPVARFLQDVDPSGFQPINIALGDSLKGTALGNDRLALGWVRDVRSAAPDWPTRLLQSLTVSVSPPGPSQEWVVEFYDTDSGEPIRSLSVQRGSNGGVPIALPPFEGSIAFKMRPVSSFTISNRGALSLTTPGGSGPTVVGSGRIQPSPGSTTPSGLAIFGFRQNSVLVTEAAVPASPAIRSGRIFAEVNGAVNTGLAIANPNNQPANISFLFTDADGQNFGQGNTTIAAGGQIAAFLDQSPFNSGHGVLGTFTFNSDVPVAAVALRGFTNERSEFLITTMAVAPLTAAIGETVIFPHFADGGGWRTQIVLVNPTDEAISGTVQFIARDVPNTLSSYAIPPRSSRRFETSGVGPAVQVGSVWITPAANSKTPSGFGIFSFMSAGVTVSQAGVPASPAGSAFRLYVEASGENGAVNSIQTGMAIANASAAPANVNFELLTLNGVPTGLVGTTSIPESGHVAMFLNQIPGFSNVPIPFQGVLRVSTNAASPVSVTGLRGRYNERGDFLITTTPPINESTSLPAELFVSHLVDAGGYVTQFILLNGSSTASSGVLRLSSQTGQPLALPLN